MRISGGKCWQLSYWSSTWSELPGKQRNIFRCFMLFHFLLAAWFITRQGITFDEGEYFSYALRWAKGHPERLYPLTDSKTPMGWYVVATGPAEAFFASQSFTKRPMVLCVCRPAVYVPISAAGLLCSFLLAVPALGRYKMDCPIIIFCFDPLIFSYGMFVASDLPSASLLVTIIYLAWRFSNTQQKKYWWLLCIAAALAVLLKQSMIYCYPLLIVLFYLR